ncbi:MAG: hypothetical protein HFI05_02205 [Lachnospiraceae bacterium]|jgi:hypothetical protein|nr:hypothetical protein [Lachnospiraceae bacterium]
MDITGCYSIDAIIRELEIAFQIDGSDFEERDMNIVIQNVKTRIGRQYQIDLTSTKINAIELELGVYRNAIALFIDNIARLHAKICGLCQVERFLTSSQVSLSDVNYLGYTEDSLKTLLVALQRKVTLPLATDAINSIKDKLGSISNCREKRLCLLIIIADAIGFPEVVAAIAEILYIGMIR